MKKSNHHLFTMGINNGLRVGDLLKLKVKAVQNLAHTFPCQRFACCLAIANA